MKAEYDVIVIGLGIVGSAALWRLSHHGGRVLGVDAGAIINTHGSSYGASRIFRRAYWEGERYLPLLSLSHTLWQQLDATSERKLIHNTGGLFLGPVDSGVVALSAQTAKIGNIAHRTLSARETNHEFPAFSIADSMESVYEEGAYTINADAAKMQMLNLAVRQGAEARFGTKVTAIRKSPYGLTVELNHQRTLETKKIIVSTGATIGTDFIEELKPFVSPKSVPIFWFKPKPEQRAHFSLGSFPAFLYQMVDGSLLYGAPEIDAAEPGVKIGFHNRQQTPLNEKTQGDRVDERFISQITEWVSTTFPGLDPAPCASRKCVYTMSVDESFFVDESKQFPGLFYSSSCSGHGFKFATGLGEVLSQTALGKPLANKVAAFNIGRLSAIAP